MGKDKKEPFTMFPNAIYDAILRQPLSVSQLKTALFIIRMTSGYQKQSARISYGLIASETGQSRRTAIRSVNDLEAMGIIKIKKSTQKINEMRVLPPKEWGQVVTNVTPQDGSASDMCDTKLVTSVSPNKERKKARSSAGADFALDADDEYCDYDALYREIEEDIKNGRL